MSKRPLLHIVHCIDTEGPLTEDLSDTFQRVNDLYGLAIEPTQKNLIRLQSKEIDLGGIEEDVATMLAPSLLNYNNNWADITAMLNVCMAKDYRHRFIDDFGGGWVYSWHCMDHIGYADNPRRKDLGFGNIYKFYSQIINETNSHRDEINWHYHPLSFSRNPLQCATNYANSYALLCESIARRIIDFSWFPTVNRPGFHTERPDIHLFLEQWIPFDYANQSYDYDDGQSDLVEGRFGDWRRASKSWRGYHPSHDDYQLPGACRRKIFRCLNVGTRFNILQESHLLEAFEESLEKGEAILSFCNHDYRDIKPDIDYMHTLLRSVKQKYPQVRIRYSGAKEAAQALFNSLVSNKNKDNVENLVLESRIEGNRFVVDVVSGALFGPQPFLAIKTHGGRYLHDNFDVIQPKKSYSYTLDMHTISQQNVAVIAAASADASGEFSVTKLELNR